MIARCGSSPAISAIRTRVLIEHGLVPFFQLDTCCGFAFSSSASARWLSAIAAARSIVKCNGIV